MPSSTVSSLNRRTTLRVEFRVERSGRLVGEHQLRPVRQRARDRDALPLAAGQRARLVVDPVAEAETLQHRDAAAAHLGGRQAAGKLQRHLDVFIGRQRLEQIVHLEDEADLAPHMHQLAGAEPRQVAAEHLEPALLQRAQRADQRQQRGLARPRRAGHHDKLSGQNLDADIEQHLKARLALAVKEIDTSARTSGCIGSQLAAGIGKRGRIVHQNTSAGSTAITRRIASAAETRHIPNVNAKLIDGDVKRHLQRHQRQFADDAIDEQTEEPGRNVCRDGREGGLLKYHPHQIAAAIPHALQRRVLRQLIGQIGVDDLIRNQHADDEPDDRAHPEDRPGGGQIGLERALERLQFGLAQHLQFARQRGPQRLLHGGEISPGLQLDHPELDRDEFQKIRVAGQQRRVGALAHHHGAVGHEIGAQRIAADDPHGAAVDLGPAGAAVHPEKRPRAPVDDHGVGLFQQFALFAAVRGSKKEDGRDRTRSPAQDKFSRRSGPSTGNAARRRRAA